MKYLNKLIEYGIYLFVFLLPLQSRWIIKSGFNEYQTYSLYGVDILLVIVLALFIIAIASGWRKRSNLTNGNLGQRFFVRVIASSLMLLAMTAVSILFAADKGLAIYKFFWLILGMGVFWLILKAKYNKIILVYSFLAGIFFQSILGIWQFLFQTSFASKWLGMALHRAQDLGTSVIETGALTTGERWLRAYGGLDHPNMLAGLVAMGLLILIYLITYHASNNTYQKIYKSVNWVFFITFIIALFFTFSRAAWSAAIIGAAIILFFAFRNKGKDVQKNRTSVLIVGALVLILLFSQFSNLIFTRLGGNTRLEIKSIEERVTSYHEAWQIIKKHPFFGVGIGNYTTTVRTEIDPSKPNYYYQPTHNTYLLVLSEIGVFGLLLFVLLLTYPIIFNFQFSIFNYCLKNLKLKNCLEIRNWKLEIGKLDDQVMFSFSMVTAIAIMMLFDHFWWSLHFGILLFWFAMGLVWRWKNSD